MLSQRINELKPSKTTMSAQLASELKAQGKDVISLGLGEPDFSTPKYILDAVNEAMYKGEGHHYSPSAGMPELRQAIADFHADHDGYRYQKEEVFVCDGAKMALYFLCQILLNPGDQVLIPSPYWVSYLEQVKLAGGQAVIIPSQKSQDYKITVEQVAAHANKQTKFLILNTPSNPTGMVYSGDEVRAISDYCRDHNILLVVDEIYYRLVYGDMQPQSIMSLTDNLNHIIIVNGFSKTYAMTGWRLGYVLARQEIIQALAKLASQSNSNASGLSQYAGLAALQGSQEDFANMRMTFARRLDNAYDKVSQLPGFQLSSKAQGAFYLFPDISQACQLTGFATADDFVNALLAEYYVLVIPGSAFGSDQHIRLSYATDQDTFNQAIERIHAFIEKHRRK